jgi:hypothetical protein
MSALPKAVRKQIEQANQLAEDYYKSLQGQQPPAGDPPAGDPPAGDPPAGDPPPTPPAASGEPPAGDPPAPPANPPASPPQEGWEQKYKVLQGKYNAEVPRLQTKVRDQDEAIRQLREQLTATQNLLASLSAQRESAPAGDPPSARTPAQPTRLVKDEEVREFGADLIDVMRRVVREEQASLLPEIDRRVAPVAQRVDQVAQAATSVAQRVAQSDQQTVLSMLDQQVPKWRELNEDQGFLEWLDQIDPFSGYKRGALLQQAYKAHDGPRVVAFFNGYLKEHAAVTPPAPPAAPAPAAAPQKTLDKFVAPGTPKTGAASTPDGSGKRVWSRAEIGKFYADVQAGRYRTRPDEQKKLEADIFAAQREGRIR